MPAKKQIKKQHLPQKICATCDRPFTWRKKWKDTWEDVKYCSKRCKGG
ncbi:DUF2256 domain-containing protein [Parasphingorhabdus cellanae]|uniref:DUF2256 domain-containing protein n=1 Tax=Parasphingorhabdus cellanae TaxID=2806553 RepID=A0ABX7T5F4_9SPHN|nr:DUF2256 domain-containing protein [Parasphingorhabdus cellanae]QTD56824.1 DUF2256 domain-containing protein [Parasphingorhabdus cellanae]